MNIRDQILKASDLKKVKVDVPEWNVTVWISEMSASSAEAYSLRLVGKKKGGGLDMKNFMSSLLVACLVDEDGNQIFTDPGDVERLSEKKSSVVQRLYEKAEELNGMDMETHEEEKKS